MGIVRSGVRVVVPELDDGKEIRDDLVVDDLVELQGERGWRSARRFGDLFEADAGTLTLVQRFVPDFEMVVDDIAKVTDDELDARGLPPEVALTTAEVFAE